MKKVIHSFDELTYGTQIKIQNWNFVCIFLQAEANRQIRVQCGNSVHVMDFDQYQYSLVKFGMRDRDVRFLAIKYPIEKLFAGMAIIRMNYVSSLPLLEVNGDTMVLEDLLTAETIEMSYSKDYAFSLVYPEQAEILEDDVLRKVAYQILRGDPMALDFAKDILKC